MMSQIVLRHSHQPEEKKWGGEEKTQQTTQETFFFRISKPKQPTVVTTAEMPAVGMKAGMGEGQQNEILKINSKYCLATKQEKYNFQSRINA